MPTTEHIHLPLYTDEETPDLSTTGHYNHAMEIIDANVGELEAKDAELAKDIADERDARVAGDAALDGKVSAETAAREAADNAINATLASKADQSALNNEVADRKAADTALDTKLAAETKARTDAETEIMDAFSDLNWRTLKHKPFYTIGSGLKVVSNELTVDASAISAGITGNTTWGEIEQV